MNSRIDAGTDEGLPPHPTEELGDDDVLRELEQLYRTRLDTLRRGSDAALEHSSERIAELEAAYLRRRPQREVSARRLRPDESSLTPPRDRTPGETAATPPAPPGAPEP